MTIFVNILYHRSQERKATHNAPTVRRLVLALWLFSCFPSAPASAVRCCCNFLHLGVWGLHLMSPSCGLDLRSDVCDPDSVTSWCDLRNVSGLSSSFWHWSHGALRQSPPCLSCNLGICKTERWTTLAFLSSEQMHGPSGRGVTGDTSIKTTVLLSENFKVTIEGHTRNGNFRE